MIQYKARQPLFYSNILIARKLKKKKSRLISLKLNIHVCTFIEKNILIYLIKKNIMCVASYAREIKLEFFCIKITDLTVTELLLALSDRTIGH